MRAHWSSIACAQRIHDTRQIEALSATVETKTKETDALRQLAHSLAAKLKQAEATVAADAAPPVAWSLEAAVESVEPEAERQKKKKKNAKKPKADLRESAPFGDDGEAAATHVGVPPKPARFAVCRCCQWYDVRWIVVAMSPESVRSAHSILMRCITFGCGKAAECLNVAEFDATVSELRSRLAEAEAALVSVCAQLNDRDAAVASMRAELQQRMSQEAVLRAELQQRPEPSASASQQAAPRAERADRKGAREAKRSGDPKKQPEGGGEAKPVEPKHKEPPLCRFDASFGKQCRLADRCKFRHSAPAEGTDAPGALPERPAPATSSSRAASVAAPKAAAARSQPSPLLAEAVASPSSAQGAKGTVQVVLPQAAALRAQHRFAHTTMWSALGDAASDDDDDEDESSVVAVRSGGSIGTPGALKENANPNEGAKASAAVKVCHRCGEAGHLARQCPSSKAGKQTDVAATHAPAIAAATKSAGASDPKPQAAKPVHVDACSAFEQSDYGTVGVRWKKGKEHEYEDRSRPNPIVMNRKFCALRWLSCVLDGEPQALLCVHVCVEVRSVERQALKASRSRHRYLIAAALATAAAARPRPCLLAVFDGHGGDGAAECARAHVERTVSERLTSLPPLAALKEALMAVELLFEQQAPPSNAHHLLRRSPPVAQWNTASVPTSHRRDPSRPVPVQCRFRTLACAGAHHGRYVRHLCGRVPRA